MIHFRVDMQDLTKMESALGMARDKSGYVLRAAINATAKQTVTLLTEEANREYQISQPSRIAKTMSLDKATLRKLTATVTSKGRVNELYNFMVNPRRYVRGGGVPGGYSAHSRRGASYRNIALKQNAAGGEDPYRAFVVKYKSGHKTLAQRRPDRRMKKNPDKEFVKTLFAPSVPNMLGNEKGVYGVVEPQIYDLLQQNIQEQIHRFLK
ncbi:MAG: hypothetical protein K2N94_14060 [Lachnospiraceae bacterium]|nr:hypothetical protein [Lachnospiraceae bacterium]